MPGRRALPIAVLRDAHVRAIGAASGLAGRLDRQTISYPARVNFTEHELRELSIDVGYELRMVAEVGPMASPIELQSLGSALLESSMLHVRNLDTFLGATEAADDDVIALHYLDTWTPTHVLSEEERADLNKRLMHLSKQRLRLHAEWDRTTFVLRSVEAFSEFQLQLRDADGTRAAWFERDVAAAIGSFEQPMAIALRP